jgi:ComF family protein
MLSAASNSVVRLLFAPCCAACDQPLDEPLSSAICPTCWREWPRLVPPTCTRCGDQLPCSASLTDSDDGRCDRCRAHNSPIAQIRSAGVYDGSLRHMIHALKYRKRRMIAPLLARRIRADCADALAGIDAVVPIPMHWRRRWDRGFNQADDIAVHLGLPVWRVLRRRRGGPPQASLPAAARLRNAEGAYALSPLESLRRGRLGRTRLAGANLVLVDDVVTTGATLEACADVLLAAGAARVAAVTAARAVAAPRRQRPPGPRLSLVRRR